MRDAIKIAINDYLHNPRVGKSEHFVELFIQEKDFCEGQFYIAFLFPYNRNRNVWKYPLAELLKYEGKYVQGIPTDYIIRKGRMFCWENPDKTLTSKMINLLKLYDQVLTDPNELMILTTDGGPILVYHFCQNDYTLFNTQIEEGFYREEVPCLPCSHKKR